MLLRQLLEQRSRALRQELRQEIVRAELHIGPLPHPDVLAGYDKVVPGAAERILTAFEEQGRHRQELERYALVRNTWRSFSGLACGFAGGGLRLRHPICPG